MNLHYRIEKKKKVKHYIMVDINVSAAGSYKATLNVAVMKIKVNSRYRGSL
jgi:hypothetical protein